MKKIWGIRADWAFALLLVLALGAVLGVNLAMEARENRAALADFQQDQLDLAGDYLVFQGLLGMLELGGAGSLEGLRLYRRGEGGDHGCRSN